MALIGYQVERQKIEDKIVEIKAQLGGKAAPAGPAGPAGAAKGTGRVKRVLSEAARARIAAAQRKRWAAHRKQQAAAGKK